MSMMMSKVQSLLLSVTDFYKDLNPSTLSGAIDIVCIKLDNGEFKASPFHVRFGKLQLLRSQEKVVTIAINNTNIDSIHMKLGDAGEAFFVKEIDHLPPLHLATSPIPAPTSLIPSSSPDSSSTNKSTHVFAAANHIELLDLDAPIIDATAPMIQLEPYSSLNNTCGADDPHANTESILVSVYDPHVSLGHSPDPSILTNEDSELNPLESYTYGDTQEPLQSPNNNVTAIITSSCSALSNASIESVSTDTISPPKTTGSQSIPAKDPKFVHCNATPTNANPNPKVVNHFSDTELDPPLSHHHLIKKNPLSDTELEFHEFGSTLQTPTSPTNWIWGWGKFPTFGSSSATALDTSSPTNPGHSIVSLPNGNLDSKSTYSVQDQYKNAPVALSLAGYRPNLTQKEFDAKRITNEQFAAQSDSLLASSALVVCLEGRFYPWSVAGAMLVSMLAFGKPLSTASIDHMLSRTPTSMFVSSSTSARKSSWRFWSRSTDLPAETQQQAATPASLLGEFYETQPLQNDGGSTSASLSVPSTASAPTRLVAIGRTRSELPPLIPDKLDAPIDHSIRSHSFSEVEPQMDNVGDPLIQDIHQDLDDIGESTPLAAHMNSDQNPDPNPPAKYFIKTLRLTSDELKNLNLKPGCNHITFTVATPLQGTAVCHSRIFLWGSNERVVISDIDGTITKSDALGHIFTMLGRDWTHSGVASLYTQIRKNGYQILYLTSRAIGQAQYTRNYLNKVEQGTYQLPDGPVFLSPDRLLAAFAREVIQRRPEEFKVACLRDIRALFAPDAKTPFYAGFGNRHTDAYSYRAVGVPTWRIYTINPAGQLKRELLEGYKATYLDLSELVDQIFPPVMAQRYHVDAEFNDWSFWRRTLPSVSIEELGLNDDDDEEELFADTGVPSGHVNGSLSVDQQFPGSMPSGLRSGRMTYRINGDIQLGSDPLTHAAESSKHDQYDGEDEDSSDDEHQALASRVAEIAAFPYI